MNESANTNSNNDGTITTNTKMLTRLMFRLLPVQIILAGIGAVNGIVSSIFASNYVGVDAMSAVGLFLPFQLFLQAVCLMLSGGSVILCGKYMGQNNREKMQNCFAVNVAVSSAISVLFIGIFLVLGLFDLTRVFTGDEVVRSLFNKYLIGQAIGVLPLILGCQFPAFLALENKSKRTFIASIAYIFVNLILNYLFVKVLRLEAFGLALASSLGMWVFLAVQAECFITGKSLFKISFKRLGWGEGASIIKTGFPGAVQTGYQTARGFIVNHLIQVIVGSVGLSAMATANNLLAIFWAFPNGMLAVSRLMISVSVGEEDRQTLTDTMRVMMRKFFPILIGLAAVLILLAEPMTNIFYHDPSDPVYMMTVWGFRILPVCLPLAIIATHFCCYWQASGRQGILHFIALMDGVVCVAGFSALLIKPFEMNGVYAANVLNGVVIILIIVIYSCICRRHFPHKMDDLMVIPDNFGAPACERMDISIRTIDEVVTIARRVQEFCMERGIDDRRAYLAGLSMEEMAGNIVEHGFTKDKRSHTIDVRVVHKEGDIILRIKDDCVAFDPADRTDIVKDDITKNIGIRMIFKIAKKVQHQSVLGLNVLTVRI